MITLYVDALSHGHHATLRSFALAASQYLNNSHKLSSMGSLTIILRRTCTVSIQFTDWSTARSWQWSVVRFKALELTAACKNRYRWDDFLGGFTTYQSHILIRFDHNVGNDIAQMIV